MHYCLLCGNATQHRFSHSVFELYWCGGCEFGRLAGKFTPEIVATFYPTDYYTHSTGRESSDPNSIFERLLVHAAWRLDQGRDFKPGEVAPGATVCDIGCGNGEILRSFKQCGYRTVGIEPDPQARSTAADAGMIFPGTAEEHQVPEQFDVVVMSHVLEHCIDPIRSIDNAVKLLADNGTLVIEVPNNAALGFAWFQGKWPWTDIPRHLSFFTDRSLEILLGMAGLSIKGTFYSGFTRQFLPSWRSQIGSMQSGWPLLLASAMRGPRRKYDSIRIHAARLK